MTDWLQICDDIDDGEHDEGLDQIARAVTSRREVVARRNARRLQRTLAVGDRVMLTNGVTPRFMDGMVGVVSHVGEGAARVTLDDLPSGRGRPPSEGRSKRVLVPFINLEKLDEEDARLMKADPKPADEVGDDEEYDEIDEDDA